MSKPPPGSPTMNPPTPIFREAFPLDITKDSMLPNAWTLCVLRCQGASMIGWQVDAQSHARTTRLCTDPLKRQAHLILPNRAPRITGPTREPPQTQPSFYTTVLSPRTIEPSRGSSQCQATSITLKCHPRRYQMHHMPWRLHASRVIRVHHSAVPDLVACVRPPCAPRACDIGYEVGL